MSWLKRCVMGKISSLHQIRAFSREFNQRAALLSKLWIPTGGISCLQQECRVLMYLIKAYATQLTREQAAQGKLIRAGYLRQSEAGIFQLLPLGLRVLQKIEALLDKHMHSIGASRISLSALTSVELWQKSGRYEQSSSEIFRVQERRNNQLMLAPTHEEDITMLVADLLQSYKDLPLRVYQITRKYRDEKRPRHGLLRCREFLMKDLYTFDLEFQAAMRTYDEVSGAYDAFFADLRLPVVAAQAASGSMGGSHSHEYLLPSNVGEDTLASCSSCGYCASGDAAAAPTPTVENDKPEKSITETADVCVWRGTNKECTMLINAWYPRQIHRPAHSDYDDSAVVAAQINIQAVQRIIPELDASVSDTLTALNEARANYPHGQSLPLRLVNVVDWRLAPTFTQLEAQLPIVPLQWKDAPIEQSRVSSTSDGLGLNLLQVANGDECPQCKGGLLRIRRATELGHTFYLAFRYSEPLNLMTLIPNGCEKRVPVQMGCYGIGVSRIMAAAAEHLSDEKGLNWPSAIAPYEVVMVPSSGLLDGVHAVYSLLADHFDVVVDDRRETFGWKMTDADSIGFPVIVVLGRQWRQQGICEVQCRRLDVRQRVAVEDLRDFIKSLLSRI